MIWDCKIKFVEVERVSPQEKGKREKLRITISSKQPTATRNAHCYDGNTGI